MPVNLIERAVCHERRGPDDISFGPRLSGENACITNAKPLSLLPNANQERVCAEGFLAV